ELGQAWRAEQAWLGDRPLLVYAGTLGYANGVGWLAELACALDRLGSNVAIAIVGDGREHPAIEARARELGVFERNLFMLGRRPKATIPAMLSASSGALSCF